MSACDDPTCACRQLAWMEEMERIEQEVFPDARPRSEVTAEVEPFPPGFVWSDEEGRPVYRGEEP